MKLVVDSNVLFTFFWKGSVFKNFLDTPIQLFSPEYALEEINKYSLEIMKKTSLSVNPHFISGNTGFFASSKPK